MNNFVPLISDGLNFSLHLYKCGLESCEMHDSLTVAQLKHLQSLLGQLFKKVRHKAEPSLDLVLECLSLRLESQLVCLQLSR